MMKLDDLEIKILIFKRYFNINDFFLLAICMLP